MKEFFQYLVSSRQFAVGSFWSAVCSGRFSVGNGQFSAGRVFIKALKELLPAYCSLICCLLLCCQLSNAQIYPVQVTPQLIPPYSFKLSDYTTTTREKLFVNLLLTDAQEAGRQVRLKMFVEGPGISFQSVDFVSGALPIVLDGGINQRLTNLDLQPYFNLNNLVGISPQQYGRQLPEGQYRFCFEVYDQFSGQRISNRSCANIFLVLNDPPILNVPGRGDLVTAQNPQNIIFNWTPRHINAGAVQYEFTLKELWDTGMDPRAAFLASPPLYQTTTFANTLHYGPAQTPLLEGRTYGWQVRAFVSDGITDTSLFRNNGLSEIFHFTYQADCHPPHFVLSEAQNSQTVKISWQMGEHVRYRVQYRKKGYGDGDWFGLWSQGNEATVRNLEAGTVYEFRVGGDCIPLSVSPGGGESGLAYSAIHEFTTPTEDEMAYYNCGIPPEIEINNQEPLLNLGVNEVFTAGDFPVVVREASGSNGYFSGWGYITLPFLEQFKELIDAANIATGGEVNIGKFSRIRVEFDNIKINTDYQLVEGMVQTSYDPNWSGIVDVDQAIADIGNLLELLSDELNSIVAALKENWELNRQVDAAIEILETNLDDPNNGLTDEQEENIRNFISDKEKVKQVIIEEKQKIANGERDEVIKQNLINHLVEKDEGKSKTLEEFKIHYCDSIVKIDKRNDILKECNKLKLKYQKEDSTATKTVQMKLRVIQNDETKDIFFPSKDGWQSVKYNEDWEVDFDSIPSGEYFAELKVNDTIYKHEFRMQKECTSGYCCEVCDKDLTVTEEKLKVIFPNSNKITNSLATHFNTALKKAGFKTCKSHVHFFAQVFVETKGYTSLSESPAYRYERFLEIFRKNTNVKSFFKQSFFDDNEHLDYFRYKIFKSEEDSTHNYIGENHKTFKWNNSTIDTVRVPLKYSYKKEKGAFSKKTFNEEEKKKRDKKLFGLVYSNRYGNGKPETEDGYKYMGKGAIHLTWKDNYTDVQDISNTLFGEAFEWVNSPEKLINNEKDAVYSAVGYFYFRLKKDISKLNNFSVKQASYSVNGGYNGLPEREAAFQKIMSNRFFNLSTCKK